MCCHFSALCCALGQFRGLSSLCPLFSPLRHSLCLAVDLLWTKLSLATMEDSAWLSFSMSYRYSLNPPRATGFQSSNMWSPQGPDS